MERKFVALFCRRQMTARAGYTGRVTASSCGRPVVLFACEPTRFRRDRTGSGLERVPYAVGHRVVW
jgi:hypothetical protein